MALREGTAPIGNVIVLEAEDDLHDTVKPRLMAAGADLSRVHFLNMVKINDKGDKRMFSLVTDLPKLKKKVEEIGDVALIVVDPMSAYLGRTKQVDTFRTTDVRNVLAPFTDLAGELNVAIIAIMHFNKKVDVTNVLLRVSDSAAFTAAARHLYGVIDDRANKRKLFVRGKNNVAAYDQKTLAYRFGLQMVGFDAKGEEIWALHIIWDPKPVDITPSEAMQGGEMGRPSVERNEAKDWLQKQLAYGPKLLKDILRAAEAEGISRSTLYRAKKDLQIVATEDDVDGLFRWSLPGQPNRQLSFSLSQNPRGLLRLARICETAQSQILSQSHNPFETKNSLRSPRKSAPVSNLNIIYGEEKSMNQRGRHD